MVAVMTEVNETLAEPSLFEVTTTSRFSIHTLNLAHGKLTFRAVFHPHPHGLRLADTDQQRATYCGKQSVHVNTMQNGGYTLSH